MKLDLIYVPDGNERSHMPSSLHFNAIQPILTRHKRPLSVISICLLSLCGVIYNFAVPLMQRSLHGNYSLDTNDDNRNRRVDASTNRVVVLTVWNGNPDLLGLHVKALRQFLKTSMDKKSLLNDSVSSQLSFDYVAILNSLDMQINQELRIVADSLNVTSLSFNNIHDESTFVKPGESQGLQMSSSITSSSLLSRRHAHAINLGLHKFLLRPNSPIPLDDNDILLLIDSDVFPLLPIHLDSILLSQQEERKQDGRIASSSFSSASSSLVAMPYEKHDMVLASSNFILSRFQNNQEYRDFLFDPIVEDPSFDQNQHFHNHHPIYAEATTSFLIWKKQHNDGDDAAAMQTLWISVTSDSCPLTGHDACNFYRTQISVPTDGCQMPELLYLTKPPPIHTATTTTTAHEKKSSSLLLHDDGFLFYHLNNDIYNNNGNKMNHRGIIGSRKKCSNHYLRDRQRDLEHYLESFHDSVDSIHV